MRSYSTVAPSFWTGPTAKALRKEEPATYLVACYLVTCPSADMTGLYNLPKLYIGHECGLTEEQVEEAIEALEGLDFCEYDHDREFVFVRQMARYQVGEKLAPSDKRRRAIERSVEAAPSSMRAKFMARYGAPYGLQEEEPTPAPPPAPENAPQPLQAPLTADIATLPDLEAWGYGRFKVLQGAAVAAWRRLLPVTPEELDAIDRAKRIFAWTGAARVVEAYREEATRPTAKRKGKNREQERAESLEKWAQS